MSYDEKQNRRKIYSLLGSDREHKVGYQRLLQRLKEDNPTYYQKNIIPSYREAKEEFEKELLDSKKSCLQTEMFL